MTEPNCPRCQSPMQEGLVPDRAVGSKKLPEWHPGPAGKTLFGELRPPEGDGYPVIAYRCTGCGLLEWYARR